MIAVTLSVPGILRSDRQVCCNLQDKPWKPLYNLITLEGDQLEPAVERGCSRATVSRVDELLTTSADISYKHSAKLVILHMPDSPGSRYTPGRCSAG